MDSTSTPPSRQRALRSVRSRMLFWTLAVTVPIYAGALYMSYELAARRLEAEAQRDMDELAAKLAAALDATIRPIEGGIRTIAYQLEQVDPSPQQHPQRILGILRAWPEVYGSTIALEAASSAAGSGRSAPYYFRRGDDFVFADLANEKYAYDQLPWYRRAADSLQPVWSPPYFDAGGGNTWMVTYSVPFFRKLPDMRRVFAGVVTADLHLHWMKGAAAESTLGPIGMGWLWSAPADQMFVAPIGATVERVRQFDGSMNPEAIRKVGEIMLARNVSFGLLPREVAAKPAYLAVRTVETLGWRAMLVIPQTELLAEARQLLNRQLLLGAIGLVLLIVAIYAVTAGITSQLETKSS